MTSQSMFQRSICPGGFKQIPGGHKFMENLIYASVLYLEALHAVPGDDPQVQLGW